MKDKELEGYLKINNIKYDLYEHEPLLGMEDSYKYTMHIKGEHCKNLFLCDKKKTNYYHILTLGQKAIDLKSLQETIGTTRLSFVSPSRLMEILGVGAGYVNPLTAHKTENNVHYFFDEELKNCSHLIFCPNVNDESVVMSFEEFDKYLSTTNKQINYIKI